MPSSPEHEDTAEAGGFPLRIRRRERLWRALAEDSGLITEVDDRVAAKALRRVASWTQTPETSMPPNFRLAVNVSADRREEDLAERMTGLLEETGVRPGTLQVEITERLALQETRPFHELRERGVRLAIDDFGRGYSSLMYLRRLDADTLKIDRFFVEGLVEDESTSVIVRSVMSIAAHLGLDVIAEGVETATQRDHLRQLGCRLAQGYWFARPMPADELGELLRSERRLAAG